MFSPDGRRVAFTRHGDLYAVEVAGGREIRLTQTGSDTVLNGRLDWVYEEELASPRRARPTPGPPTRGRSSISSSTRRASPPSPSSTSCPSATKRRSSAIPRQGTRTPSPGWASSVSVADGAPGPERLVSIEPDDAYVVPEFSWQPDSRGVAFQHLNREQNELQLRIVPVPESSAAPLGAPRTVLTERSDTWVNVLVAPRFLRDGKRFLWLSERDGFAHLYSCEMSGDLPRRHPGGLDGGRPRELHPALRAPAGGRAHRLRLLHGYGEGPPRAALLPRAARRHRTHAPEPGGRLAPGLPLPGRAVLRGHVVRRGHATSALGRERRREAPSPGCGRPAGRPSRVRARDGRVGERPGQRTAGRSTPCS